VTAPELEKGFDRLKPNFYPTALDFAVRISIEQETAPAVPPADDAAECAGSRAMGNHSDTCAGDTYPSRRGLSLSLATTDDSFEFP
jgi:hypothetical protein